MLAGNDSTFVGKIAAIKPFSIVFKTRKNLFFGSFPFLQI
jgi:hypothetical protein